MSYFTDVQVLPVPPTVDEIERQVSPLKWLVKHLSYKPGWRFELEDGLTPRSRLEPPEWAGRWWLRVLVDCTDSLTGRPTTIIHRIAVPHILLEGTYRDGLKAEKVLRRWLLDAVIGIERHEACEFFTVDGAKPFFPPHEPGKDPYVVREVEGA